MRVLFRELCMLVVTLASVISFSNIAHARPAVIHEQEQAVLPEEYVRVSGVCLMGDELVVLAMRHPEPLLGYFWAAAHFIRQSNGTWQFRGELAATFVVESSDEVWSYEHLACDGQVAGLSTPNADSFILERKPSGWEVTPLGHSASHVAVHEDAVAFGGTWGSPTSVAVYRKNAAGVWSDVSYALGNPGGRPHTPEIVGPGDLAIANGELVAAGSEYSPTDTGGDEVSDTQVFDLVNGEWRLTATLEPFAGYSVIGDRVAILMANWTEPGDVASLFTRDASGAWTVQHTLLSDEVVGAYDVVVSGERAFALVNDEIRVFESEGPRRYRHMATLAPSDLLSPPDYRTHLQFFSVDDDWVAAGGEQSKIYLFHVPATLPTSQRSEETFEDNVANDWSVWGHTNWQVVRSNGSRAYRQSNTQGDARAILETSESEDQSIQADVRIDSLIRPTSWAGFIVRYTDPQNFYYLLVDRDSIDIRRIVNGVFGPIAKAPFNLALGRTYRLRLEAVGSRLRAFVDGDLVAEVIDDTHAQGKAGLTMWRAVTTYDNIVVSTNPQTHLFEDVFDSDPPSPIWLSTPASAWTSIRDPNNNRVYRQSLLTGSPRAVTGAPTQDQILTAQVRPVAFNANRKGSVGVITRYVDHLNFYYAILTDTDWIILGKRVNGAYQHLDQARMTVSANTTYDVRAEAIGSSLRVYVNDTLRVEAQDATFGSGRYGLVTFEAAADYDNFRVIRP